MNFLDHNTVQQPKKKRGIILPIVVVLFVGALGVAGYYFQQYRMIKNNPDKVAADQVSSVVAQVGKLMLLPTDEQPTLATVTEPEKLKTQPFFAHAKKGDRVLVYNKAKKAILYDPELNKIVEVAPLGDDTSSSVTGASNTTATSPTGSASTNSSSTNTTTNK